MAIIHATVLLLAILMDETGQWGKGLNPLFVFGFFLILSYTHRTVYVCSFERCFEALRESTFLKQDLTEFI